MKKAVLYVVFICNMIITSTYILFDLLSIRIMNKLDFTFLIIYDVICFIIFGELLKGQDKK